MDTCKNKATGKTFILLDYLDDERAMMITPAGEVKNLEIRLFSDFKTDREPKDLLKRGDINLRQIERFKRVQESR